MAEPFSLLSQTLHLSKPVSVIWQQSWKFRSWILNSPFDTNEKYYSSSHVIIFKCKAVNFKGAQLTGKKTSGTMGLCLLCLIECRIYFLLVSIQSYPLINYVAI
jgi:hypothetical protein